MKPPTHDAISAPNPLPGAGTPVPGQSPVSAGERTTSAVCVNSSHPGGPQQELPGTESGVPSCQAQGVVFGDPGAAASSYVWTPLHTPELARLIFAHPATCHLPPAALTDLLHTAGHDLATQAQAHLIRRLTPAQTRDFLAIHDPADPGPGTAWIKDQVPDQASLLARLTAGILDDITAGPYQYLTTHTVLPRTGQ